MKFIVEFNCDNAAFENDSHYQVHELLWEIGRKLINSKSTLSPDDGECPVYDANGNRIGFFAFMDEDDEDTSAYEEAEYLAELNRGYNQDRI